MSVTNAQIINRALRELNVIAEGADASAEQGEQCLKKLNNLMELWREIDIDWGWFEQTDTTDDCPIPDYAEMAVWSNLAIVCASQYGATVSQELASVANRSWTIVHTKALREGLDNTSMSHLPRGLGNYNDGYDITTDS